MISAVVPGTVGFRHGSAALVVLVLVLASPTPAPPEVPVGVVVPVAAETHWLGLDPVIPGASGGVAGLPTVPLGAPWLAGWPAAGLAPPGAGVAPPAPALLALAAGATVSANAARLGRISRFPRISLSWACGVS
jgi:hypothetical protein